MKSPTGESQITLICGILTAVIFFIDISTPNGYVVSFLYILPVFISLWSPRARTTYGLALVVSILTIIAVPLEPLGDPFADIFNRPVAIAGFWIVVLLGEMRKKSELNTEKNARDLERSNAELQQFAYVVSHDLKGPLATIIGFLALLEGRYQGRVLDEKAGNYVRNAIGGAERMSLLIDGLLDFARVDSKGITFEMVNMDESLSIVEQNLGQAIKDSNATITHDPLPTVKAEPIQIMELLQNLIANALKFRRPDVVPRVHISATKTRNYYTFSVEDNGIGIPKEQQKKIFQIFHRLHSEQEYSGTGLGLAIAQEIVERHGGRIWVESEVGKGTTFLFTIPIRT
jgi:light-regulated signal transduction histidine kinase (bacteriophytochrome)